MRETPAHVYVFGGHRWHHAHMLEQMTRVVPHVGLVVEDGGSVAEAVSRLPGRPWVYRLRHEWDEGDLKALAGAIDARGIPGRWTACSLDDFAAPAAAALNDFGGLRTYPVDAALSTLHKHRLRGLWNHLVQHESLAHCAPVPFALLRSATFDSPRFRRTAGVPLVRLDRPVIVKPDCLDDSLAVSKVEQAGDLSAVVEATLRTMGTCREAAAAVGLDIPPDVLVEGEIVPDPSFGPGAHGEFSAQMLSRDGSHRLLGVTDKIRSGRSFSELGHLFPSAGFPRDLRLPLEGALTSLLRALDVELAVSTWDFMVTAGGRIALVEGQLRPSGNHVMELHERATGINPFARLFGHVANEEMSAAPSGVAAVVLPSPSTPLERVERVEIPRDGGCGVSVDERVYSRPRWAGPEHTGGSFIRVLATAASAAEAVHIVGDCVRRSALIGRNAQGHACSTGLQMPACRLGAGALEPVGSE